MKILIIGITGRLGKRIAAELLHRNHQVVGANRRPERVPLLLPDLKIPTFFADTAFPEQIERLLVGVDVVVLATAPTREHPEQYAQHSHNVIDAVKKARTGRLIAVSHYKALRAPDGRPMLEAEAPHRYFHRIEAVHAEEAELFCNEKDLDWLLVAPPAELFPYGEVTARYRVGTDTLIVSDSHNTSYKEVSTLSMEDFAYFIAEEIDHPTRSRELVTLAY